MLRIVKDFSFPDDGSPLLFTMDVKSLYTVIPNHEGLNALKHYLDLRVTQEPPTETILRLAELVLTLNNFEFYGSHYQQVRGVALEWDHHMLAFTWVTLNILSMDKNEDKVRFWCKIV